MAGVEEALVAGAAAGIRVIAGVELSAVEETQEIHVLGLHLGHPEVLATALTALRAARARRAEAIVAALHALGVAVTLERVMAEAGGGAVGRPHVARALIAGGWARDQRDAFDRYLGAGRPAYIPKERLTMADAIALIHSAGGIAVYAHPGRDGTRDRLEMLRDLGLDGVEVRHPGHGAEDEARLSTLAEFLDLVPSGGSDWHGALDGPRVLGSVAVPESWVERQAERARRYRGANGRAEAWNCTAG
jgi:predicted metal-dependent phosphoesterase TrpH